MNIFSKLRTISNHFYPVHQVTGDIVTFVRAEGQGKTKQFEDSLRLDEVS